MGRNALVWSILSLLSAATLFFAQNNSEDVVNNLGSWLTIAGLGAVSEIVTKPGFAQLVSGVAFALFIVSLVFLCRAVLKASGARLQAGVHSDTDSAIRLSRDTPLRQAIAYAAFGDWNNRDMMNFRIGDASLFAEALDKFHQLAADGNLHVWGISSSLGATDIHQLIPSSFWHRAALKLPHAFGDNLVPKLGTSSLDNFTDLQVSRTEFVKEWPLINE